MLMELLAEIAIVALRLVDTLENGFQEGVLRPLDQCYWLKLLTEVGKHPSYYHRPWTIFCVVWLMVVCHQPLHRNPSKMIVFFDLRAFVCLGIS
jgi:hypothetical protein